MQMMYDMAVFISYDINIWVNSEKEENVYEQMFYFCQGTDEYAGLSLVIHKFAIHLNADETTDHVC